MRFLLLLFALLFSACADRDQNGALNFDQINTSADGDDEEGGLSSSGGGEYILDRYNPWFMDKADAEIWKKNKHKKIPVKYCINHDPKLFSLSKEKAALHIKEVIKNYSEQLNHFQDMRTDMYSEFSDDPVMRMGSILMDEHLHWECAEGACPLLIVKKDETVNYGRAMDINLWDDPEGFEFSKAQIATQYQSVTDCKKADLEIILGNFNSPKVTKLRKQIGNVQFRYMAGVAIKTKNDYSSLRSKGFIYLAADKGKFAYAGPRNIAMGGEGNIWDFETRIPKNAKIIEPTIFNFYNREENFDLHKHFQGPFKSIFAHEFAHTLGVQHSPRNHEGPFYVEEDLMGVNTPADLISKGLVSNAKTDYYLDMFDRSLLPLYKKPMQLNFARYAEEGDPFMEEDFQEFLQMKRIYLDNPQDLADDAFETPELEQEFKDMLYIESYTDYLKHHAPTVFKYFFKDQDPMSGSIIKNHLFSFEYGVLLKNIPHKLNLIDVKTNQDQTFQPIVSKSYEVEAESYCDHAKVKSKITFKSLFSGQNRDYKLIVDPDTGSWQQVDSNNGKSFAIPYEQGLISFRDTTLCGRIFVEDDLAIDYRLMISHSGQSTLMLIDPISRYSHMEYLRSLDFKVEPTGLELLYIDFL